MEGRRRGGREIRGRLVAVVRFQRPPRAAAAKVYARWIAGGRPDPGDYKLLQDFLFRYIAAECGRLGLPVHIHTLAAERMAARLKAAGFPDGDLHLFTAPDHPKEGGWGELDSSGNRVSLDIEAGEKFPQNYRLEVTNPGGHSSRPVKDNAIYHLAAALTRISDDECPVQFNDANRAYFSGMAKIQAAKGNTEVANAMKAFLVNPNDAQAVTLVASKDPSWNATLRTTCVATMLDAGHATNALPQRARANVNCRIFPGESVEAVRATLAGLAADPAVSATTLETRGPTSAPPPLTAAERVTHSSGSARVTARGRLRSHHWDSPYPPNHR